MPDFFTMDALIARWGVTRETIIQHVNDGRLGFVNLSPKEAKKERRGPRQIGFTEAHIAEFEMNQSARWGNKTGPSVAPLSSNDWDGIKRLGTPIKSKKKV
jgi:hypothetical protein